MCILNKVQYSVFHNNRIDTSPDMINKMLSGLNEICEHKFIPNMISGKSIDLLAGRIVNLNNISFISFDKQVVIACLNERIDVTVSPHNSVSDCLLVDYVNISRAFLSSIMNTNHIYSNRLAINIELFSDYFDAPIQETSFGKGLCSTLSFYNNLDLEEWSSRVNLRKNIKVEENELINVITELSSKADRSQNKRRFLCHLDINTLFENNGYRFNKDSLDKFDHTVMSLVNEILGDFKVQIDE